MVEWIRPNSLKKRAIENDGEETATPLKNETALESVTNENLFIFIHIMRGKLTIKQANMKLSSGVACAYKN